MATAGQRLILEEIDKLTKQRDNALMEKQRLQRSVDTQAATVEMFNNSIASLNADLATLGYVESSD